MATEWEEIKTKCKERRYSEVLSIIEQIESRTPLCPPLLVLRGRCMQLDEDTVFELSAIEQAFRQALLIDEHYSPALLELGWFYLNVLDDPREAAAFFERAIATTRFALTEEVIGMAKCLSSMKTKDAAKLFIDEIQKSLLDQSQIGRALDEIE